MSRRVTISVPDDVAAMLDGLAPRQVSAYVTEAVRRRRLSDEMRAVLRAAGHREFPFDPVGAARRLASGRVDPAVREAAVARLATSLGRPVDDVRADLNARTAE